MNKYRKKPVIIEAVQWTGKNQEECIEFLGKSLIGYPGRRNEILISTLEGHHIASKNDWIIKGIKGEFYPCKPDIFEKTYEKA